MCFLVIWAAVDFDAAFNFFLILCFLLASLSFLLNYIQRIQSVLPPSTPYVCRDFAFIFGSLNYFALSRQRRRAFHSPKRNFEKQRF